MLRTGGPNENSHDLAVLANVGPGVSADIGVSMDQAQRLLSAGVFESFVSGANTLWRLRQSPGLVLEYLQAMPSLAAEHGEEVIAESLRTASQVSSMASGAAISDLFRTLPAVASHLRDQELLSRYFSFVHQLAATSPRGLRPMLANVDELLGKLTIGGLRRWADFGIQNYRRDYDNLVAYFDLELADSRAMVESERHGVLLVQSRRHLRSYLRALWGHDFVIRPIETGSSMVRPYVENGILFVPDAVDDQTGIAGLEFYRAMLAHLVSHMMHGPSVEVVDGLVVGADGRSVPVEARRAGDVGLPLTTSAWAANGPDAATSSLDKGTCSLDAAGGGLGSAIDGLSPVQRFFVGFVEDARVELCAVQRFPGLRSLWLLAMGMVEGGTSEGGTSEDGTSDGGSIDDESDERDQRDHRDVKRADEHVGRGSASERVVKAVRQLAIQLLDPEVNGGEQWLNEFASRFFTRCGPGRVANGAVRTVTDSEASPQIGPAADRPESLVDVAASVSLGLELFEYFNRRGSMPSLRLLNECVPDYRNDNHSIWYGAGLGGSRRAVADSPRRQVRYDVSPLMMAHTLDCELAGDDAQEIWTCRSLMRVYEDDLSNGAATFNDLIGQSEQTRIARYQEWDYQTHRYRPDWVTVHERRAVKADAERVEQLLRSHVSIVRQVCKIIDQLSPTGIQRQRQVEDGDELDLGPAIDAMIALRTGETPSRRIMRRNVVKHRDLVVEVLLDLSQSTNERVAGSNKTVLQLTLEASVLLALAIEGVGDPFAISGFASDGRHDVRYARFKDFDEPMDSGAKARLAGMSGSLSTRMGAALRHAGERLERRPEGRKLVLLVTDGMPSDIDETDQRHLVMDTKKAVEELRSRGVSTHCLTIDSDAEAYVEDLFGPGGFTMLDHVERLPEVLPRLFAQLTKS